jgi:urease accessory protein
MENGVLDQVATGKTLQRARGAVELRLDGGGLRRMYQSGSAKVILPKVQSAVPEAVLINTAGGMTAGDRFSYGLSVSGDGGLTATTQAAERVYRGNEGAARLEVNLTVSGGSRLHWLPQETILFNGSRMHRRLEARLDGDSELLIIEPVIFGRTAMGERLTSGYFSDMWRVYRGEKLIHAEATRLDGDLTDMMQRKATAGGAVAMATVLFVAPDAEARLEQARSLLDASAGVTAGASAWGGKLVLRFLASDAAAMRRDLMRFLTRFRNTDLPRVWQM